MHDQTVWFPDRAEQQRQMQTKGRLFLSVLFLVVGVGKLFDELAKGKATPDNLFIDFILMYIAAVVDPTGNKCQKIASGVGLLFSVFGAIATNLSQSPAESAPTLLS